MSYGQLGQTTPLGTGFQTYDSKGNTVSTTANSDTRPYSLDKQKATLLIQDKFEQQLQMMSTTGDILDTGMADTEDINLGEAATLPDEIGMSVSVGGENRRVTMPVAYPMTGNVNSGTTSLLGNEKALQQKGRVAYYNEFNDGLVRQKYGVAYNYENAYGLFEKYTAALTKYWAETKCRWKRQCIIEGYNEGLFDNQPAGLFESGFSGDIELNPNWIINGDTSDAGAAVDDDGMPIWDNTPATFLENVVDALIAGGDDFDTDADYLMLLDKIDEYTQSRLQLEKFDDGTYVFAVPLPIYYRLTSLGDADTTNNNFASYFVKVADYAEGTNKYPGEFGMYRNAMRIVPDERWVSLVADNDSYAMTFEYKMPGNEDNRERAPYVATDGETAGDYNFMLGMILGKAAYIERKEKDLHFRYETQDYERFEGVGTFIEVGYNLNFVIDDDGLAENRNSAVVALNSVRR